MPFKLNTAKADEVGQKLAKGDRRFWSPSDGRNRIRIMPPWAQEAAEEGVYFFETAFHYGIGPDEKVIACPRVAGVREDCYLCELAGKLKKSKDEDDQAESRELQPKRKFLLNIVDLNHPENGVVVWSAGSKAMKQIHAYVRDREYDDITDLEEGYDLTVEKTGSGLKTEYFVKAAKRPSAFPTDELLDANSELEGQIEELTDLVTFLEYPTNGEMKAAYEGTTGKDASTSEEEEEEEKPRHGRTSKPSRARGPKFPDEEKEKEEAEEEEEEEDEEEEDEKPRRATSKTKPKPDTASRRVGKALRSRTRER